MKMSVTGPENTRHLFDGFGSRFQAHVTGMKLQLCPGSAAAISFASRGNQKNRKSYAQNRCEQLVRNFRLKCFFGSQLLRPSPVMIAPSGCSFPRPIGPICIPRQLSLASH
jgi:hypothetical protein